MITKINNNPESLLFVVDEDMHDPEFLAKLNMSVDITLKNDLVALTENDYFLRVIDRKLSQIYTMLQLFMDNNTGAIERIENVQQEVYDQTWVELVADTPNKVKN